MVLHEFPANFSSKSGKIGGRTPGKDLPAKSGSHVAIKAWSLGNSAESSLIDHKDTTQNVKSDCWNGSKAKKHHTIIFLASSESHIIPTW